VQGECFVSEKGLKVTTATKKRDGKHLPTRIFSSHNNVLAYPNAAILLTKLVVGELDNYDV